MWGVKRDVKKEWISDETLNIIDVGERPDKGRSGPISLAGCAQQESSEER